jgi:hypothetical protein
MANLTNSQQLKAVQRLWTYEQPQTPEEHNAVSLLTLIMQQNAEQRAAEIQQANESLERLLLTHRTGPLTTEEDTSVTL